LFRQQLAGGSLFSACILGIAVGQALFASDLCVAVDDYADLPLPGASVTAIDLVKGGTRYDVKTDSKGRACLLKLPEGVYSVEAVLTGFMNVRYYPVRVVYPDTTELSFRLPFSEITEGGFTREVVLSGTLRFQGKPLVNAEVCALESNGKKSCTTATDIGEYALSLAPGSYDIQIRTFDGKRLHSRVDLTTPGAYRDSLGSLVEEQQK
jgi:hypothetical protein